ncbi:ankyrin repeat-containing domain protein [Lasiosphaeria ovina]|uniref:Ankyrin repeat-containing domain protein n=1 Tax=Lasiosphaeria ovina TaxID=92902 RepID=A0AAE0NM14_9PEZI|nr:ankyrin repeat-containing domain protein [Lasiosphaeria ovina]
MPKLDWDAHRADIERLYIAEGKCLTEVMDIMKRDRGFLARLGLSNSSHTDVFNISNLCSKPSYERKMRAWGLQKNTMGKQTWDVVAYKVNKRKRLGKESTVYEKGVRLSAEKLQREIPRHTSLTLGSKFTINTDLPSPKTPEGIVVRSPSPLQQHLPWNYESPWSRFIGLIWSSGFQGLSLETKLPQASDITLLNQQLSGSSMHSLMRSSTMIQVPSYPMIFPTPQQIMPDAIQLRPLPEVPRIFLTQFFLLSNNFTVMERDGVSARDVRLHDEHVVDMIERLGSAGLEQINSLSLTESHTTEAIKEHCFVSILRSGRLDLLRIILETGIDLDMVIYSGSDDALLTPLQFAAGIADRRTSLKTTRLLLEYGAKPLRAQPCPGEQCLLSMATRKGHLEVVGVLVNAGAYPCQHATISAIENGFDSLLQQLLDAGADVNFRLLVDTQLDYGMAAYNRHYDDDESTVNVYKKLVDKGARLDHSLLGATRTGSSNLVSLLLHHRAPLNCFITKKKREIIGMHKVCWSETRTTALGAAIELGFVEIARMLYKAGAKELGDLERISGEKMATFLEGTDLMSEILSKRLPPVLDKAIDDGDQLVPKILIRSEDFGRATIQTSSATERRVSHAHVYVTPSFGFKNDGGRRLKIKEAAIFAAENGTTRPLDKLLEVMNWEPRLTGLALTAAIARRRYGEFYLVQHLLEAGASFDEPFEGHISALAAAVAMEEVPLVKTLLSSGADANKSAIAVGKTALQAAADVGHLELVDMLLKRGADVNGPPAPSRGATALQFAASRGYLSIATRLLDAGANVNAPKAEREGRTALMGAAEHGRIDMLHLLLNRGANVHGSDRTQFVEAVFLAEQRGRRATAGFLKSHGGWTESDDELKASLRYRSGYIWALNPDASKTRLTTDDPPSSRSERLDSQTESRGVAMEVPQSLDAEISGDGQKTRGTAEPGAELVSFTQEYQQPSCVWEWDAQDNYLGVGVWFDNMETG